MNYRAKKSSPENNSPGNGSRPQKRGLPCGICGEYSGGYKISFCHRCEKVLCIDHTRRRLLKSDLPPQFRRGFNKIQFTEYCPECDEEIQREEQEKEEEERQRQKEIEEEIANRVVNQCSLCTANDAWTGGQKVFPSGLQLSFHNCDRCGRLCCSGCISGSSLDGYDLVCNQCYDEVTQQESREREEYWREREEEEKTFEE